MILQSKKHSSAHSRGIEALNPFFLMILGMIALFTAPVAYAMELGSPPRFPEDVSKLQIPGLWAERERELAITTGGFSVNPQNREESRDFYNDTYLASEGTAMNWTGNHASCNEGATAQGFRDAVLIRLNYFRAMGGVPADVMFSSTFNGKDQEAALMMSVNNALSHEPPMNWTCYSADGDEAAFNSNLALGVSSWDAITGYMRDPGAGNSAGGHRRWILYPQTQTMGTGDVPSGNGLLAANGLWVFDDNLFGPRPPTREEYVAWPPPGYVPYQVVFARWSFSYDGADFSSATVSMTSNGMNITVDLEPIATGFGENTLLWIPMGLDDDYEWEQPPEDTTYTVTISDVSIGGNSRTFTYDVIVFDPATAGPAIANVLITGLSTDLLVHPMAGDPVQFSASTIGAGTVYYRFLFKAGYGTAAWDTNSWVTAQNWSTSSIASLPFSDPDTTTIADIVFPSADNYIVIAQATDDAGGAWTAGDPQAGMSINLENMSAIQLKSVINSVSGNPQAGEAITFTASTIDTAPVSYRFLYKAGYGTAAWDTNPWVTAQNWSTNPSAGITFPSADNYIVIVQATDNAGGVWNAGDPQGGLNIIVGGS